MASLNSVILMGNLTRDPELRTTPNGTSVASFGLAVNRRYRQGEEQREEVCFIDIVCFGRQAETVEQYLGKGNLVTIEGRLQWRSWETPEGQKRSKHEVIANNVQFMPRSGGQGDGSNGYPTQSPVSSYDPTPEVGPAASNRPRATPPPPTTQDGMFDDPQTGYGDNDDIPFARCDLSDRYLCADHPPSMRA